MDIATAIPSDSTILWAAVITQAWYDTRTFLSWKQTKIDNENLDEPCTNYDKQNGDQLLWSPPYYNHINTRNVLLKPYRFDPTKRTARNFEIPY